MKILYKVFGSLCLVLTLIVFGVPCLVARGLGFLWQMIHSNFQKGMDDYDTLADKVRTP
jgi:hypothetical protein